DKLTAAFEAVMKRARNSADFYDKFAKTYADHGMDRALASLAAVVKSPAELGIARYGLVANILSGNTWREKLKLAVDMAETSLEPDSIALADEALAEIFDGQLSIEEIFGGFGTALAAWKTFIMLSSGKLLTPPKYMAPDIERLNDLFTRLDLPHTRDVLLKRVARGLGSTQALSKDGREVDRAAFIDLVSELTEPTGMHGGPQMVEAVVLRTKVLLGEDGQDLPIDIAIRQALYLMPSQAARLGVLLDLTASDLGRKHDGLVRMQLIGLLDQLRSLYDLFPAHAKDHDRMKGIESLRNRLGMSALSDELKASLASSLGKITKGDTGAKKVAPVEVQAKPVAKNGELRLAAGQVLFHAGERGSEAFLIVEGSLEVFRMHEDAKQHLATLGRGEIIGEMSLIDNQPRMASACALEPCTLMALSQTNLQERMDKLAQNDKVLHMLLRTLTRRLRGLALVTD
ncbi:MAG TPA: cyclic nucleotide-binding domain-containing protein, partial [Magnetovibrio sp.]